MKRFAAAALLCSACATSGSDSSIDIEREGPDPELRADRAHRLNADPEHAPKTGDVPVQVLPPSTTTLPPVSDMAAAATDQRACLQQVNAIDESFKDREKAFALLVECLERGKLISFDSYFEDRWRPFQIKQNATEQARLAGLMIANRGGKLHGDLPIVRKKGIDLIELSEALEDPSSHKGRLVLIRATVTDQSMSGTGTVLELDETTEQAVEYYERSYVADEEGFDPEGRAIVRDGYGVAYAKARQRGVSMPTGRTLTARAAKPIRGVENEKEYLFLAKFEKKRPPADDLDEHEHADVTLLYLFKPRMDALPLSR